MQLLLARMVAGSATRVRCEVAACVVVGIGRACPTHLAECLSFTLQAADSAPFPWDLLDRFPEVRLALVGEFHGVSTRFVMLPGTESGAPIEGCGGADSDTTARYSNHEIGCRI